MLKINQLAVRLGCESKRPEHVEGRMANYDTVSKGRGNNFRISISGFGLNKTIDRVPLMRYR
jgi:hypothetical protein